MDLSCSKGIYILLTPNGSLGGLKGPKLNISLSTEGWNSTQLSSKCHRNRSIHSDIGKYPTLMPNIKRHSYILLNWKAMHLYIVRDGDEIKRILTNMRPYLIYILFLENRHDSLYRLSGLSLFHKHSRLEMFVSNVKPSRYGGGLPFGETNKKVW